jgi:TP901 family phage tail tape measure protein
VAAGERILRVIIAGDALGAVSALDELSHGLERAHSSADAHGGGIMSSLGGMAKGVGLFALGTVAAVGGIAAEIFHISSGYEQNLNAIQAFTHSTNDQMKSLESQLYSMSPKFAQMGQTVGDASEALYQLTKAGASSKDGITELVPTMALAKATNTDYTESAKEMTRVLDSFGLKADQARNVADILTNATHTSTQTLQDMADGLKYVSVAAHDFGINLQTTAAVTAMYANAGIQGTNAGTAFRQMLLNLSAPTKAARDAIKAIGLQAFDSQGRMKPLADIFQQLQDKFGKGLDTHSLEKIAPDLKAIFGARGVEPILAAIRQGGGGLDQYIKLMNRTGEASAIAEAKSKGLSGTFNQLRATMESATQHLYMQVAPKLANFLNPFVEALPGYLSKAAKYGEEIWTALSDPGKAAKGPNGGSGFTKGLVEVGKVVHGEVLPALGEIAKFVKTDVVPVVERIGKVFITQIVPFVARAAGDIARLLLPIVKDIARFIKTDVVPSFKQWGEFISAVVIPKMEVLWTKTQPILKTLADFIEKKIIPLLDWAWKNGIQPILKDLEPLISDILDALAGLYGFLAPVIKWIIDVFGGPLIDMVKGFLSGVFIAVEGVIEFLRGLLAFLKGVFTGDWGKAWDGICKMVAGAWDFIYGLLKAIIFGKIVKLFVEGGKLLMDAVEAPFKWIAERVTSLGSDIAYGFTRMKDVAKALWDSMWNGAKDTLTGAMKSIGDNVVSLGEGVLKWFRDLPGTLGRILSEAASWLLKTGGDIVSGLLKGITDGAKTLWKWFTDLPGNAEAWFKDAATWLEDAGLHMMEGFIKGVEDMAGKVKDSAVGVVKDAYNGVKDFLGINSPSRLYMGLGHGTGEGFINGISAKASAVHDAVVGMVTVPANRFTDAFRKQQQTASTAAATAARSAGQVWATAGAVGAAPAGGFTVPVTINVAGSVQAERDFARNMSQAIRDEIRQIARRNGGKTGLTGAF